MNLEDPLQEVVKDLKEFMTNYLDKHLTPLIPKTTPEQRKPLLDCMLGAIDNTDLTGVQSLMEKQLEECAKLVDLQVGRHVEKGNELFDKAMDVVDETHEETMVYSRMKGQEMMMEAFGIKSSPRSFIVGMGGGIVGKDGKMIEFGNKL